MTSLMRFALIFLCTMVMGLSAGWAEQRSQDFSSDPGWVGYQNRIPNPDPPTVEQNFGYSSTNHAGAATGEIGGVVYSTHVPATYAMVLPTPLGFDQPLTCSGSFTLTQAYHTVGWTNSSDIYFGWFNAERQEWRPINFMGFTLRGFNEPVPHLSRIELAYGTQNWQVGGLGLEETLYPGPTKHTFSFAYDPAGSGTIGFTLDGETIGSMPLKSWLRPEGAIFNRFGIFNNQIPGQHMTAYFDDLIVNGEAMDFSSDPQWEENGNRATFVDLVTYGAQDFGYSETTSHAGGETGEIGGRIWRVDVRNPEYIAWYGDPDVGELTLDHALSASGKIAMPRFEVDTGMWIGWFNADTLGDPNPESGYPQLENFMGVYMDSLSDTGRLFNLQYLTSAGSFVSLSNGPLFLPDGRTYDWSIEYDPAAYSGNGKLTVTLGGQSVQTMVASAHRAEGATFTHFGILSMIHGNGKDCLVYLDDLEYTVRGDDTPTPTPKPAELVAH